MQVWKSRGGPTRHRAQQQPPSATRGRRRSLALGGAGGGTGAPARGAGGAPRALVRLGLLPMLLVLLVLLLCLARVAVAISRPRMRPRQFASSRFALVPHAVLQVAVTVVAVRAHKLTLSRSLTRTARFVEVLSQERQRHRRRWRLRVPASRRKWRTFEHGCCSERTASWA